VPILVRAVVIPVVALTIYFITPFEDNGWLLGAGIGIVATAIGVPYAVRRILRIRRSIHPLAEALAVISLLLSLVVVGFAGSYYSISLHTDQFPSIHTRIDALYFTIVTIGTVGYGDITPAGQGARALVSFQIMLNLTLIATIVRLLGRVATTSRSDRGGALL
jgi:voltage-gated potassium channel